MRQVTLTRSPPDRPRPPALWAGTSVLITGQRGRVLIQRVDYRTTFLLPGGAVDANEGPVQGAAELPFLPSQT